MCGKAELGAASALLQCCSQQRLHTKSGCTELPITQRKTGPSTRRALGSLCSGSQCHSVTMSHCKSNLWKSFLKEWIRQLHTLFREVCMTYWLSFTALFDIPKVAVIQKISCLFLSHFCCKICYSAFTGPKMNSYTSSLVPTFFLSKK